MPRFLFAVCLIACFVLLLSANETPSLLERQRAVYDQIDEIKDFDEYWELDLQRLTKTNQLLRDSESLFIEPDGINLRYLSARLDSLLAAAEKTEDAKEKDALFDECVKVANLYQDKSLLERISNRRQYGSLAKKTKTVEDALKIPNLEWRNPVLSRLAHELSLQTPPDFAEALRAAEMIEEEIPSMREMSFATIAMRQAQAGLFDDAETTYRLMTIEFDRLKTLLTFVWFHERQGNIDTAKRRIDEVIALGHHAKESTTVVPKSFMPQFFSYCRCCLIQLAKPELAKYLYEKMVVMKNDLGLEWQNAANEITFATAAAHLGDRDAAERFFQQARSLIAQREFSDNAYRPLLIAALYDAGFEDEAAKALAEYVRLIPAPVKSNHSSALVSRTLAPHGRFKEAVAIAKTIDSELERFRAYDNIVGEIRFRLSIFPSVGTDAPMDIMFDPPPRKPFSSPQEILDIAEMLTDEPDGKSLESYRKKLRRLAEKLAEKESRERNEVK